MINSELPPCEVGSMELGEKKPPFGGFFNSASIIDETVIAQIIPLTYEEWRRLWHVPAVLDSIVDTTMVRPKELESFVDKAISPHVGETTMPRTVIFWKFTYVDLQRQA